MRRCTCVAREHSDRKSNRGIKARRFGASVEAVDPCFEHVFTTPGMHGQVLGAKCTQHPASLANRVGDVMKFDIKKDIHAQILHDTDGFRTSGREKFQADLGYSEIVGNRRCETPSHDQIVDIKCDRKFWAYRSECFFGRHYWGVLSWDGLLFERAHQGTDLGHVV